MLDIVRIEIGDFTSLLLHKNVDSKLYEVGDSIKCVVTDNLFDEEKHCNKIYISERKTREVFSLEHHIGEHIVCNVEKIKQSEEGKHTIVVSYGNIKCLISEKQLIEPYNEDLKNGKLRSGQKIEVVYKAYYENISTVNLDMRPILKEREKEKINAFHSRLTMGDIIDAEVLSVMGRQAELLLIDGDIKIKIPKDELSPNKVLDAADEVFVGEHIKVQYMGDEAEKMIFSRRHLKEDIYDDELYDMNVDQLLSNMGLHTRRFVGKATLINENYFITNLMSVDNVRESDNGKLLIDPVNGKNLVAIVDNKLRNYVSEGGFYEVELNVATSNYRRKQGTPYQFCVISPSIKDVHNPYEESVMLSFKKHTSPSSNTALANLLEEVGLNLYSGKKRMFFELLQNADDAAAQNGVNVKVQMNGEYFTLTHDGYSFNKHDFDSIISAAKSTKSANKKKTGYKGIGFKSVFTSSTLVSIKSGGYTFSFDKDLEEYNDFSKFYFHVNDIEKDTARQAAFLRKYENNARVFKGVKDIPWQLLPIWADRMTIPYANSIFNRNENVGIALKMDSDTLSGYQKAVEEVFDDPRFMLFLRKTKRVQLIKDGECRTIQKNISKNGELVTLVNSFNPERRIEDFRIYSVEDIPVNDVAFEEAGVRIKREERINTRGEKEFYYILVGKDGDLVKEITGVPDRIASATETTISFAIKMDETRHISPTESKENSFYAYLPMNEDRFSFPFYINADFIPNSDRERINSENPWNHFLFYLLGKSLVKMVSDMASADEPQYLNLLCKDVLDSEGQDTSQLVTAFNKGYSEALLQVPYILDDAGNKVSSSSIVYDDSGLSEAIGHEAFYALLGSEKKLPHPMVDSRILKNGVFRVEIISVADVVKSLTDNILVVKEWIPSANESVRAKFFEWITQKKIAKPLAEIVPAYEFSDGWKSYSELTEKTVILSESTVLLRDELESLGFKCSLCLYENHPFHDYISVLTKKKLFLMIKECDISSWLFENRKNLFLKVVEILKQEVGSVSEWNIFKNQEGQFCHLSQMFQYSADTPSWLYPYLVDKSEYWECLDAYLIPTENVFSKIVTPNIDSILTKVDIVEIYDVFSQNWQPGFTKQLFSKNIPQNQMLHIVEQSNDTIKADYIKHLDKLELFSDREYVKDSNEYQVVNIAAGIAPSTIKGKIYIDGIALSKYVLKDEVSIPYVESKTFTFSLSEIIPLYSTAQALSKVSESFKDIPFVEKIFEQQESNPMNVRNELVAYLTSNNYLANVPQFCFMMIYTAVRGKRDYIDTSISNYFRITQIDSFVSLLDNCFRIGAGKILGSFIKSPYVGNTFSNITINGLYIDCDEYTLPKERVPEFIVSWADSDEKKKFLIDLGIHNMESRDILRRKSFKKCELDNIWNITDSGIIKGFLDWVQMSIPLPVTNENQVSILKGLCNTIIKNHSSFIPCKTAYLENDISDANEWTDERYMEWKKNSSVCIMLVDKAIQYRMYYGTNVMYKDGNDDFMYFPTTKRIYISEVNGRTPAVIMADVYSKSSQGWPFTKDDWDKIFRVSVDKYQELEATNKELEAEIKRLNNLLNDVNGAPGKAIETGTLSDTDRKEINREARYAAKEFLEQNEDFDCTDWNPDESRHLVSGLVKFKGSPITVAVTSSLERKLYLHPRVFAELMQNPDNVLLNYGADKMIHSLSFKDVFSGNPNVNLIFDTDVVCPQRIAELANDFMGSKRTCFVVENPNYSQSDRIKHFGLNEKKSSFVEVNFTDDEIFDF